MITAILIEDIPHKQCTLCKYSTISVDEMLEHLNEHRLDELEQLKSVKTISSRYKT